MAMCGFKDTLYLNSCRERAAWQDQTGTLQAIVSYVDLFCSVKQLRKLLASGDGATKLQDSV